MTGVLRARIIGSDARHFYTTVPKSSLSSSVSSQSLGVGPEPRRVRPAYEGREATARGGVSARAMRRGRGRRFAIVTLTDISQQKTHCEEKLRAANARLKKYQIETEQELELAARVQQSLAPAPFLWGSLRVDTFYQPAHTIPATSSSVKPLKEKPPRFVGLRCLSGHGISSALVASRICSETIAQLPESGSAH